MVYVHKFELYEKIGPGIHPCHWCGTNLVWRHGTSRGTLLADHLDGNKSNNARVNLVPSCNGCNTIRGRTKFRAAIRADEAFVERLTGARTRATECICEICGRDFLAETIRLKQKTVRVCSKSCAGRLGALARWGPRSTRA